MLSDVVLGTTLNRQAWKSHLNLIGTEGTLNWPQPACFSLLSLDEMHAASNERDGLDLSLGE